MKMDSCSSIQNEANQNCLDKEPLHLKTDHFSNSISEDLNNLSLNVKSPESEHVPCIFSSSKMETRTSVSENPGNESGVLTSSLTVVEKPIIESKSDSEMENESTFSLLLKDSLKESLPVVVTFEEEDLKSEKQDSVSKSSICNKEFVSSTSISLHENESCEKEEVEEILNQSETERSTEKNDSFGESLSAINVSSPGTISESTSSDERNQTLIELKKVILHLEKELEMRSVELQKCLEEKEAVIGLLNTEERVRGLYELELNLAKQKLQTMSQKLEEAPLLVLMDLVKDDKSINEMLHDVAFLPEEEKKALSAFLEKLSQKMNQELNIPVQKKVETSHKGVQVAVIKPQENQSCGTYNDSIPQGAMFKMPMTSCYNPHPYPYPSPTYFPLPQIPIPFTQPIYQPYMYPTPQQTVHVPPPVHVPLPVHVPPPVHVAPPVQVSECVVNADILSSYESTSNLPPPLLPQVVGGEEEEEEEENGGGKEREIKWNINPHQPSTPSVAIACPICGVEYDEGNLEELNVHVEKEHLNTNSTPPITCPICEKQFDDGKIQELNQHVEKDHMNFICPVCNAEYSTKDQRRYYIHVHAHFPEEPTLNNDWSLGID